MICFSFNGGAECTDFTIQSTTINRGDRGVDEPDQVDDVGDRAVHDRPGAGDGAVRHSGPALPRSRGDHRGQGRVPGVLPPVRV